MSLTQEWDWVPNCTLQNQDESKMAKNRYRIDGVNYQVLI